MTVEQNRANHSIHVLLAYIKHHNVSKWLTRNNIKMSLSLIDKGLLAL